MQVKFFRVCKACGFVGICSDSSAGRCLALGECKAYGPGGVNYQKPSSGERGLAGKHFSIWLRVSWVIIVNISL